MRDLSSILKSGFALLLITSLLSCTKETVIEAPKPSKPLAQLKAAKPGAAIKLASDPLISIVQNQRILTDILLDVQEPNGELVIELSASPGLNIENTLIHQRIKFESRGPLKIPVTLSAIENGRYYLNVHTYLNDADTSLARNLAVIVQVGPLTNATNKSIQLQKSAGENIIVLPAKETISAP